MLSQIGTVTPFDPNRTRIVDVMSRPARLIEMVHLLSGRRARTIEEIADRFEISERTAYRDLADLAAQHIPIYKDEHGYRLLETATLRPLNLTSEEHALLKIALYNPALRHQPALLRRLEALEAKLDAASSRIEESPQALQLATIDRSGPNAQQVLEPVRVAISTNRTIEIHYHSLSGGRKTWRRLDPWQLFERAEAWYVIGRCHNNDDVRIFRLDRISGVRAVDAHYEVPTNFDLDDYLEGTWKLFKGDGAHKIHLRFDPSLAPLILNAQHHPDETVKERPSGSVDYQVTLSSLDEIARWVVGFGGRCTVVEPPELATAVTRLARRVLAQMP